MQNNKLIFLKTFIWATVIMILCVMRPPSTDLDLPTIPHLDKIVHFGMYFVLSLLLLAALKSTKLENIHFKTITIAILYGVLIEIIQDNLGYRSGDIFDFVANSIGAVTGTFTLIYIDKIVLFKKIIYPGNRS